MKINNKKGFITVYVMLAMLFFVVFVTTASITATRKLKLQKEANTAIFELYDENIEGIVQAEQKTIPIYTQAQFVKIINWLKNPSSTEYILIEDTVYELNKDKSSEYKLNLRADIYLTGELNSGSDKEQYKYIPNNIFTTGVTLHEFLKSKLDQYDIDTDNENPIKTSRNYNIYIDFGSDSVKYGLTKIPIRTALEFLQMGWDQEVHGVKFGSSSTYEIQNNIQITQKDIDDFNKWLVELGIKFEYNGEIWARWGRKPEFQGVITTKENRNFIIDGLEIDTYNFHATEYAALFQENLGVIENLTFINVKIYDKNHYPVNARSLLGVAVLVGYNYNNGRISNCQIARGSSQITPNIIDVTERSMVEIGGLVVVNTGIIEDCGVHFLSISGNFESVGLIARELYLVGDIFRISIGDCKIDCRRGANAIGGVISTIYNGDSDVNICGVNIDGKIEILDDSQTDIIIGGVCGKISDLDSNVNISDINISDINVSGNILINVSNGDADFNKYIGGILGKNEIENVKIRNVNMNNEYGNIKIDNVQGYSGGILGYGHASINNCIVNGEINTYGGRAGGIAGSSTGSINNCLSNVNINNCLSNVNIDNIDDIELIFRGYIGGIKGEDRGDIENCAYIGKITVEDGSPVVGGILGVNTMSNDNEIKGCLMNGIIPEGPDFGAILGRSSGGANLTNNYYNQAYRYIGINSSLGGVTNTSYPTTSDDLDAKINTLKASIETAIANAIASGS